MDGQTVETGIERVDENNAPSRQQARHQFSERRTVGLPGTIGLAQRARDLFGAGAFEGLRGGVNDLVDGAAEHHFADAAARIGVVRGQIVAGRAVARHPGGLIHFGEVVVLGGEPKDGNRVGAAARGLLGAADGGDGLVKGVGRAGEEADLLAGYDGRGARRQTVEIVARRRVQFRPEQTGDSARAKWRRRRCAQTGSRRTSRAAASMPAVVGGCA